MSHGKMSDQSSSAAVLAASSDRLRSHGSVQVSTLISHHQLMMTRLLQLMMTRLESKLAHTHVNLTGPTTQQVLQLMMTRLESKVEQTHVTLTGLTRQQVLQLMMTIYYKSIIIHKNRALPYFQNK